MFTKKQIRSLPLLLVFLPVLAFSQGAVGGAISGVVTDGNGQPLVHCIVELRAVVPAAHWHSPEARTDDAGYFAITNLAFGTYLVGTTSQVKDGYPNSLYALYSGSSRPRVTLSPDASTANINIVRKDRAARITKVHVIDGASGKAITVTDPNSGNVLESASIEMTRAENAKFGLQTGVGAPVLFVPAQIPVIIKVWAQGYSTWYYGGAADREHAKPLLAQAGDEITLDVVLYRLQQE
jgi:hypothetical protein